MSNMEVGKTEEVVNSKRKRTNATATTSENSQKALQSLNRLSSLDKHKILETLITNPLEDATNMVIKKTKLLDAIPLTDTLLKSFGSRAYQAIYQLDRLRPSQQFERVGDVSRDLCDLIREAKRYTPITRFCLLCRIAGVFSHSAEDSGEVFKGLTSGGGTPYNLQTDMMEALNDIGDGGNMQHLSDAKAQLERVDSRLSGYCIDEFKQVLKSLDTILHESSSESDSDSDN